MDPDQSFEAYKDRIGMRLTQKVIISLETGKISQELTAEMSQYILDNINKAKTNADLLDFLEHIAAKWAIFEDVLVAEEAEVKEVENKEKVEEIEELIDQNNINGAIQVAEEAKAQDGGVN